MSTDFSHNNMKCIKNLLTKNKSIVSYEHKNTDVYKVLVFVLYIILEILICLDYLCLYQEKLSMQDKIFKNEILYYLSGIEIPDILMNIMKFQCFSGGQQSTAIISFQIWPV